MTGLPAAAVLLAVVATAAAVAGCESTQDKSARIAASLGPVKEEEGLEIKQESGDVEVLDTALLTDEFGSAAVVQLQNNSDQALINVPIAIDVLDAKGKSVYKNDIPGIEPALASMPLIAAGETAYWVHNQVLATGEPDSVEVTVGESDEALEGEPPDVEVSEPEVTSDPVNGFEASGALVNNTDQVQERVLLYGVAVDGDKVTAAGRGAVEELKAGKRRHYSVFFIGDPTEGELTVTSFPSFENSEPK